MRVIGTIIVIVAIIVLGMAAWAYSGSYDIGADSPHWPITRKFIGVTRERSIETRAKDVAVPSDLNSPGRLAEGAEHYGEMCTGCHLAPGMEDSEMRQGLYPKPPNLTRFAPDPKEAFWIIKHGIKMTAMPAWGVTHSDEKIWDMVAFLQRLPKLTPAQFRSMTGTSGEEEHHEEHEHASGHDDDMSMQHGQAESGMMPATPMTDGSSSMAAPVGAPPAAMSAPMTTTPAPASTH